MMKAAVFAFVAGAIAAASISLSSKKPQSPPLVRTDVDEALEGLDALIVRHERRATMGQSSWLDLEKVAYAHLSKARLTGGVEHYLAAERTLARAFSRAAPESGPFLARARLNFALHRFDRVVSDLARAESLPLADSTVQKQVDELRATLLLEQGRYADAEAAFERLLKGRRPPPTAIARFAMFLARSEREDRAEALLSALEPRSKGESLAWLELIRGRIDLDQGRTERARAHFERADAAFSGWPTVRAQLGRTLPPDLAIPVYEDLIRRFDDPEHVHALAATFEARGRFAEAGALHAKAEQGHLERSAVLPEAFAAHALEHGMSDDALAIAERNFERRPTADAAILLAQASLQAGRNDQAVQAIEFARATPIRTRALRAVAERVFASTDGQSSSTSDGS